MGLRTSRKPNDDGPENLPEYTRPSWPEGDILHETMRKHANSKEWRRQLTQVQEELTHMRHRALEAGGRAASRQPKQSEYRKINNELQKWTKQKEKEWEQQTQPKDSKDELMRTGVREMINTIKGDVYMGQLTEEVHATTEAWIQDWETHTDYKTRNNEGRNKAIRYLGVFFSLDLADTHKSSLGWKIQRGILDEKFKDKHKSITRSKPTRAQAVYCINAVINAALKFPLQVAAVSMTTLKKWDTAHRKIIKNTGKLPHNMSAYMIHAPKSEGGLGLESMVESVHTKLVADQITMLNENTIAGRTVRAAHKRHQSVPDKYQTIQKRIAEASKKYDLEIMQNQTTTKDIFDRTTVRTNYQDSVSQANRDVATTRANARTEGEWEGYGDGATWENEDRSGWGFYITKEDGTREHRANGRISGEQKNEAAEAQAILRMILAIHPEDSITMYCDNAECVRKWESIKAIDNPDRMLQWENRATWLRIRNVRTERDNRNTKTRVRWIRSHVDDETKRTTASKHGRCACRTDPQKDECAKPGEAMYYLHEGNEEADSQAKDGASKDRDNRIQGVAKGEVGYILRGGEGIAQGNYRKWVKKWIQRKTAPTTPEGQEPIGAGKWIVASAAADRNLRSTLINMVDKEGNPSWRFWSRMILQILPTMSKIKKIQQASPQSPFNMIYGEATGQEGKCQQEGCAEHKETTDHAIRNCQHAKVRWERADHMIDMEWRKEGANNWPEVSWIAKAPQGWDPTWTTWGLVPKQIARGMEGDHAAYKRLGKAIKIIISTSEQIWRARNEGQLEWEEEQPGMAERKRQAKYTGWKSHDDNPEREKVDQPLTERESMEKDIAERIEKRKRIIEERETSAQKKGNKIHVEECGIERPAEEDASMIEERVKEKMRKETHSLREPLRKLDKAVGTRKLTEKETRINPAEEHLSKPLRPPTGARGEYWIPTKGTRVKVAWSRPKGGMNIGAQEGQWQKGKVTKLEWPDGKGIPGVWVKYEDDSLYWHGLHLAGTVMIKDDGKKRKRKGTNSTATQKPTTKIPREALEWIGQGAKLSVKWEGKWWKGEVIGKEEEGIMVRYQGGVAKKDKDGERTVTAHTNLQTVGCKITKFMRWTTDREYRRRAKVTGCPYEGEELDCECAHCQDIIWPQRCKEKNLTDAERDQILEACPKQRPHMWEEYPQRPMSDQNSVNGGPGSANQSIGGNRGDTGQQGHGEGSQEGDQIQGARKRDRNEQSGQDMGMGSQAMQNTRIRTYASGAEGSQPEMVAAGPRAGTDCEGGAGVAADDQEPGSGAEGRSQRQNQRMDQRKRDSRGERETPGPQTSKAKTNESGSQTHNGQQRGANSGGSGSGPPGSARGGQTGTNSDAPKQAGPLAALDQRRDRLDGGERVDRGPGSGKDGSSGKGSSPPRAKPSSDDKSPGHRGRVGLSGQGDQGNGTGDRSDRSGQKRDDIHRNEARGDHSGDCPRPGIDDADRHDHSDQQKSGALTEVMDISVAKPGVQTILPRQCDEPSQGVCTRKMGSHPPQQSTRNPPEDPGRKRAHERSGQSGNQPDQGARKAPRLTVCNGEPEGLRAVADSGAQGGYREEPQLGDSQGGPVRLRPSSPEAHGNPNERDLGAEGDDGHRQVQHGQVRGHVRESK
jgi:ribonuclease HI